MERHLVTVHARKPGSAEEALPAVARVLDGGTVGAPDETGMAEIELSAGSREEAFERVRDAIAAAGAEEQLTFPETTGTGYVTPAGRAAPPGDEPPEEPPHLERGSPREEGPAPTDETTGS